MKKVLAIVLAVIMMLSIVPMTSFAEDTEGAVITEVTETETEKTEVKEIVIDFISPVLGEPAYADCFVDSEGISVLEAKWFEVKSDDFIDETVAFSAGKYYIQAVIEADEGYYFADELSVVINGSEALDVSANEDGTITAVAAFEIAEQPEEEPSAFMRFFNAVATIFLAIVRFFGEMIGLN